MLLAVTAVTVEFCVSANFLTWIGVPYVTEGGTLPEKIHPGTYLLCLALIARMAQQDRQFLPSQFLAADNKLALYLGCLLFCLVTMVLTTGTGNLIVLLDTFLPAGLLASVVRDASAEELRILLRAFRCGVCMNAVIALGEAAAHATLVPLYFNDMEYHAADGDFRPTALYDHPLTGGVMTLMGLALAPRGWRSRLAYTAVCAAALIAFGGRVAVAAAMVSVVIPAIATMMGRVLRRDPSVIRLFLFYGVSVVACAALAAGAFEAGLGGRLLGHLYWDPSAQVRLAQWSLLGDLSAWQVLFGTRREDLLALLAPLWLRSGVGVIENFWLLMFISLGVVGFPIFLLGFASLLAWCWERTGLRGRVMLASVLVVVSTSNSLGRKSTLLAGLVAAIACLPDWKSSRTSKAIAASALPDRGLLVSTRR